MPDAVTLAITSLRDDPSLRLLDNAGLRAEARVALMGAGGDPDDARQIGAVMAALMPAEPVQAADSTGGQYGTAYRRNGEPVTFLRPALDDRGAIDADPVAAPPPPVRRTTITDPDMWISWQFATGLTDYEAAKELRVARATFQSWRTGRRASPLTADEARLALEVLEERAAERRTAEDAARAALREIMGAIG